MTPKEVFEELKRKFADNADTVKEVDGVFLFVVKGDNGGTWVMDCREAKITEGEIDDPDTTLTLDGEDLIAIHRRELDGMLAFANGKLLVTGNLPLSLKIRDLFNL